MLLGLSARSKRHADSLSSRAAVDSVLCKLRVVAGLGSINAISRAIAGVIRTSERSQRATVLPVTPIRAPSFACVRPVAVRRRFNSRGVTKAIIHDVYGVAGAAAHATASDRHD